MLRSMFLSAAMLLSMPAFANPLSANLILVVPNHSGSVPTELASLRKSLDAKGYNGASVTARRTVKLNTGKTTHVSLGSEELDLTLIGINDGKANVKVEQEGKRARVTKVSTHNTRFYIVAPK